MKKSVKPAFRASPLAASEARNRLPDAAKRAEKDGERSVIRNHGRPVAAIVSIDDLELLERLEDESDIRVAKKRRTERSIPSEMVHAKYRK
jgi:prevent-host-death family protein